jgi:hypothetical protein
MMLNGRLMVLTMPPKTLAVAWSLLVQPTASGVDYLQIALDPLATSVSDTTANGVTVNVLYSGLVSTTLNVWIIENPLVDGS